MAATTAALCSLDSADATTVDEVDARTRRVVGWALVVLSALLTVAAGSDIGPAALLLAAAAALIVGISLVV